MKKKSTKNLDKLAKHWVAPLKQGIPMSSTWLTITNITQEYSLNLKDIQDVSTLKKKYLKYPLYIPAFVMDKLELESSYTPLKNLSDKDKQQVKEILLPLVKENAKVTKLVEDL